MGNQMQYNGILHSSFIVKDHIRSLNFYLDVLGMQLANERPDLGFPGAWININKQQQIHLLEVANPDPITNRPTHGGRDRHTAIGIKSIELLIARLEQKNIEYNLSQSGRKALFCRDPDGNTLEFIQTER